MPDPAGAYVLRVTNYAAVEDYTVTVTYDGAAAVPAGADRELHAHVRDRDGAVLKTQQVVVERGRDRARRPCPAARAGDRADDGPATLRRPTGAARPPRASRRSAFTRSGRGARFDADARRRAASVDRLSGSRAGDDHRRAARRAASPTRPRVQVERRRARTGRLLLRPLHARQGHAAARRCGAPAGSSRGSADFYRRASCDLLPSFKLARPVFGGTGDACARDLLPRRDARRRSR